MKNLSFFLALAIIAIVARPALAQTPDPVLGDWKIVEGKYDGSRYDGTVRITSAVRVYKVHWSAAGREYDGFGTMQDNRLFVAWGPATGTYGFVLYTIDDDSSMHGTWGTSTNIDGEGSEVALGGSLKDKNSAFSISGTNPDGTRYTGTIETVRDGDMYRITWHVADDTYYGIGLRVGKTLVIGWGGLTDNFGAVYYDVTGNDAKGTWVANTGTTTGIENLSRITGAGPGR